MDASRASAGRADSEGIGLTLVRSLVEQENGAIDIDTGRTGTSMNFIFPKSRPTEIGIVGANRRSDV
jgi:two-component sensor histidine kinase